METDQCASASNSAQVIVTSENLTSAQLFAMNKQQQEQIKQQAEKNGILQAKLNSLFQKFNIMSAEYISIKDQLTKVVNANEQLEAENLHLGTNIEALNNELLAYSNSSTANSAESDQPVKRKCPDPLNNNNSYINSTNRITFNNPINVNNSNNNINNNNFNNISNVGANRMNGNPASVDSSVNRSNSADNLTMVKKKKKKILQAINVDIKSLNQHFKNKNFQNYTIKQNSITAPVKIAITDENDVPKIRDELIKSLVSFHEFKWDAEKSKAFILRGLVNAVDDDLPYIKSELVAAGLPNNINLSLFKSGYMRANPNKKHNSLVQLILPPNSDTKILFNIKFLDHVAIKFEPLKNSRVLQCKNCQRLGHSAGGCQHPHRCVKCGANHLKDGCPRTSNKNIKLVCCNCGGEHTANNINECSAAQQFLNGSSKGSGNNNSFNISNNNRKNNINSIKAQPKRSFINKSSPSSSGGTTLSGSWFSSSSGGNPASNKRIRFNNNILNSDGTNHSNNVPSYAQVAADTPSINVANINSKLDYLISIVLKHEQLFSRFGGNV